MELENCEKTKILIILLTFTQMCLGWLSVEIAPPLSNLVHRGTFGEEDFHLNDLPQKRFVCINKSTVNAKSQIGSIDIKNG